MIDLDNYDFDAAPIPAFKLTKQKKQFVTFVDEFDLAYSKLDCKFITLTELIAEEGKTLLFDVESFPNYWCVTFKVYSENKYFRCYSYGDVSLSYILKNFTLVGFNSRVYDLPMCLAAATGKYSDGDLFEFSVRIIKEELTQTQSLKMMGTELPPKIDHVDLFEVTPLEGSLKLYAGRLHTKRMQELAYDVERYLSSEEIEEVNDYNVNDLNNTELLLDEMMEDLKLRFNLGKHYKLDLRSKSDAQIAETIIREEYRKLTGRRIERPSIEVGRAYQYVPPKYIKFITKEFNDVLKKIITTPLVVSENGNIPLPEEISNLEIKLGKGTYRLGVGGLHSSEKSVSYKSDDKYTIYDRDVASYYPAIILNNRMYPKHLGLEFLTIYQGLVDRRLAAKKAGNDVVAGGLKIAINGTFGKLANIYSCLYAPELLLQVTITGQLSLLMLIEMLEMCGIKVITANTDGVTSYVSNASLDTYKGCIECWENITNFKTEETIYSALYSRDVNNYIAFKEDGTLKPKGAFSEKGSARNSNLSRNPEALICNDAVIKYIQEGIELEDTIRSCKDIRRFVTVRNVRGGAIKSGKYLGKTVRWYQSTEMRGIIEYKTSGNKVPNSEGARPLMELPNTLPVDIDYNWYIDRARTMLIELAAY